MIRRTLVLGLALAGTTPAEAQCRLCSTPTTSLEDPSDPGRVMVEVETNLNFDRLIQVGAGDGSAVIRPDGSGSAQGALGPVGPRAMVGTAVLRGEPGRAVRVDLPPRIQLYSIGGGQIAFDQLTSDLPRMPRLDSNGTLTFRFGGRIHISGDADGDYRGDLPITAEYQ